MTMSDARKALEGATPPPPVRQTRGEPELGQVLGAVFGVGGDEVMVTVVTDRPEGARVCLITSWDNDDETAASVVLDAHGVAQLVALLEVFSVNDEHACEAHLLIDCEECAAVLEEDQAVPGAYWDGPAE